MDVNKTITVGQALDGWKSCKDKLWIEFYTDNRVSVVQFTCNHKVEDLVSAVKSKIPASFKGEKGDDDCLRVSAIKNDIQFTLNKDDTFQLDNASIIIHWENAISYSTSTDASEQLHLAYSNELVFDPDSIVNENSAMQYAAVFCTYMGLAKK